MGRLVHAIVAALVICTALSVAATPALASGDGPTNVGTIDVTIADRTVDVSDVELEGEGLPTMEIDERDATIDSATVRVDGLTVDYGGNTYEIAGVYLEIRNVGVTLEDVSIGGAN